MKLLLSRTGNAARSQRATVVAAAQAGEKAGFNIHLTVPASSDAFERLPRSSWHRRIYFDHADDDTATRTGFEGSIRKKKRVWGWMR